MRRCEGRIKLMSGEMSLNAAAYTSRINREAIIAHWKFLHGLKIEGMYIHIKPNINKENENKLSRRV